MNAIFTHLFSFLICLISTAAVAGDVMPMLLEVWINDHTRHVVAKVAQEQGGLMVGAAELADAGIKTSPAELSADGRINLHTLPGVGIRVSQVEQKLFLNVPQERLLPQVFSAVAETPPLSLQRPAGFLGQYDMVGTFDTIRDSRATSSLNTAFGGTFYSPLGSINTRLNHHLTRY